MVNRAAFIDRDGTMAIDAHYCRQPEDFHLYPGTTEGIKLLNEHGFKVIVVTNQSGIGRGYFTEEALRRIHTKMEEELAAAGAHVDAIYYCPHHPDDNCECRKPRPKLLLQAAREFDVNVEDSFVIGDLEADVGLGKAVGCRTVLVRSSLPSNWELMPDAIVSDVLEAARIITGSLA